MKFNVLFFLFFLFTLSGISQWDSLGKPIFSKTYFSLNANEKNYVFNQKILKYKYKIAVFAPMYLDSSATFAGKGIPKHAIPGLEYYYGTKIALDSLRKAGHSLDIQYYDSKATIKNIPFLIANGNLQDCDLIICASSGNEIKQLANYGLEQQINVVSALSPSENAVENNPFFLMHNPSLKAHCNKMVAYVKDTNSFATSNCIVLNRGYTQEINAQRHIERAFETYMPENKMPLKYVNAADSSFSYFLFRDLDSTKKNIIFVSVLDQSGATQIIKQLAAISNYKIEIWGMPTWDDMKILNSNEVYLPTIQYTTIYNEFKKENESYQYVSRKYGALTKSRPTEMAIKAYDVMLYYANILRQNGVFFNKNSNCNWCNALTAPIYVELKSGATTSYWENKNISLMKSFGGYVYRIN